MILTAYTPTELGFLAGVLFGNEMCGVSNGVMSIWSLKLFLAMPYTDVEHKRVSAAKYHLCQTRSLAYYPSTKR